MAENLTKLTNEDIAYLRAKYARSITPSADSSGFRPWRLRVEWWLLIGVGIAIIAVMAGW